MDETRDMIIDMSNPAEKRSILERVRGLVGMWRIEICKYRKRRTDRQNRYYWPCFVQPFGDYLRGQGHEFTDQMAHAVLKEMFLKRSVMDQNTGELYEYTMSTTELSTVEFNEYLDKCAAFFAMDCGIIVPEPNVYREPLRLAA